MFFLGYDGSGNLFVDGLSSTDVFDMAELQKGKKGLSHVTLDQSIASPGNVQWDGKYLAVADLGTTSVYRFAVTGTKGTRIGTVSLAGSTLVAQFWIQSSRIIGPDLGGNQAVEIWKYPSGGTMLKSFDASSNSFGATVSTIGT